MIYAVVVLAIWRLSYAVAWQTGPYNIFERIHAFLVDYPKLFKPDCVSCISYWPSLVASVALTTGLVRVFLISLAINAGVMFVDTAYRKLEL